MTPILAPPILDVDGNGETDDLTDGILIERWLFRFSGAGLIDGAVAADCTRCTAPEIEARLAASLELLDIDGDGETDALTDGVLVLRWLAGVTGANLIDSAVSAGCTRCTAGQIETYLAGIS